MSTPTKPTKITRLDEQIAKLKAQRDQIAARERKREDARDLRRKILAGACVLRDGRPSPELLRELSGFLTRDHDRELFGLAPLSKPEPAVAAATA